MSKTNKNRIYFTDALRSHDLPGVETLAVVGRVKNNGNYIRKVKLSNECDFVRQKKQYNHYLYFFVTCEELEDYYGKWLEIY